MKTLHLAFVRRIAIWVLLSCRVPQLKRRTNFLWKHIFEQAVPSFIYATSELFRCQCVAILW